MNRRQFLASAAGAGVLPAAETTLAGIALRDLRRHYHQELFGEVLPFWDKHGIDHQRGGFMCSLADDGTLVDNAKHHWFQGRGIWVYSFLYNRFGRDPRFLAIARKARSSDRSARISTACTSERRAFRSTRTPPATIRLAILLFRL